MTRASAPSVPLSISKVEATPPGGRSTSAQSEATNSTAPDSPVDAPSIDIDGFRQRDPDCCERVLEQFSPLIWRTVLSYVRERADGQDVYQQICLRIWERSGQYAGRGSLAGWINRIAHRSCINWWQRQQAYESSRRQYVLKTAALAESARLNDDPAQLAERRDFRDRVAAALATLPDRQSNTFILVRLQGLTATEAAAILGVRRATVRSNLRHANRKLRRELKEFEDGLS